MTLEQFSSGFIWKAPTIHPWTIKESCSSRPAFLSALVDGPLNLSVTPSLKNVIVNQCKKYMETIQAIFWLPDPIFPCSNSSKSINHPFLMDGTLSSCHACGIKGRFICWSTYSHLSKNSQQILSSHSSCLGTKRLTLLLEMFAVVCLIYQQPQVSTAFWPQSTQGRA